MIILPPYFSYVIFFIIDSFALVAYLLVFTSPLGAVINFFGNILYLGICLIKYGAKKTTERYFNLKNKPAKKILKFISSSVIPYTHLYMIYSDYKQDLQEAKEKEVKLNIEKAKLEEEQAKNLMNVVNNKESSIINQQAENQSLQNNIENQTESKQDLSSISVNQKGQLIKNNPWMITDKSRKQNKKKQTIAEEVGGIKTGLNREDYDAGVDFSKIKTYDDLVKEKEQKAKDEQRKAEAENEKRRIQGIKTEQSLRKEILERSKRRFGKKSKEAERFEDKYQESLEEE